MNGCGKFRFKNSKGNDISVFNSLNNSEPPFRINEANFLGDFDIDEIDPTQPPEKPLRPRNEIPPIITLSLEDVEKNKSLTEAKSNPKQNPLQTLRSFSSHSLVESIRAVHGDSFSCHPPAKPRRLDELDIELDDIDLMAIDEARVEVPPQTKSNSNLLLPSPLPSPPLLSSPPPSLSVSTSMERRKSSHDMVVPLAVEEGSKKDLKGDYDKREGGGQRDLFQKARQTTLDGKMRSLSNIEELSLNMEEFAYQESPANPLSAGAFSLRPDGKECSDIMLQAQKIGGMDIRDKAEGGKGLNNAERTGNEQCNKIVAKQHPETPQKNKTLEDQLQRALANLQPVDCTVILELISFEYFRIMIEEGEDERKKYHSMLPVSLYRQLTIFGFDSCENSAVKEPIKGVIFAATKYSCVKAFLCKAVKVVDPIPLFLCYFNRGLLSDSLRNDNHQGQNLKTKKVTSLLIKSIGKYQTQESINSNEEFQNIINKNIPPKLFHALLPFQKEAILFALSRNGRLLIGDEMGLGKTLQSLCIACCYVDEWPLLIVTPSSIRFQWKDQIQQWIKEWYTERCCLGEEDKEEEDEDNEDDALAADDEEFEGLGKRKAVKKLKKPFSRKKKAKIDQWDQYVTVVKDGKTIIYPHTKIVIISYELLSLHQKYQTVLPYGVIIVDESHYIKNSTSQRTKTIVPMLHKTNRVILLSGTPALNKATEIYSQIDGILPKFCDFKTFENRYCLYKFNKFTSRPEVFASKNLTELHHFLTNSVMIRRLKSQVHNDLPSKRRSRIPVDVNNKDIFLMKDKLSEITDESENSLMNCSSVTEIYSLTGKAKVKAVSEYIKYIHGSFNGKFIIFAHHKFVMDEIEKTLHSLIGKNGQAFWMRVDGSTSSNIREQHMKNFQTDERCKVALLSITACGVGLNLTAASLVIFAELHWVPGQLLQAEDRAHRLGSTHSSIDIHYLIAEHTLDDVMWRNVNKKLDTLTRTLDGKAAELDAKQISKNQIINPNMFNTNSSKITGCVNGSAGHSTKASIMSYFQPKKSPKEDDFNDIEIITFPKEQSDELDLFD